MSEEQPFKTARGNADELHQQAGPRATDDARLTTNQGIPIADNQSQLKAELQAVEEMLADLQK